MAVDNAQWVEEQMDSDDDYDGFPDQPAAGGHPVDHWPDHDGEYDDGEGEYDDVGEADDYYGGSSNGQDPDALPDPVDLDEDVGPEADGGGAGERRQQPARFDSRVAIGLAGVLAAGVVVALVLAVVFYGGGEPPAQALSSVADPAILAPSSTSPTAAPGGVQGDRPLPYTADAAQSCPIGSTPAQTMSGADPYNAFVCVRGGLDGQYIDFELPGTFVISAISFTPGWVGKDSSGVDRWSQHRVVTTVQFTFNDPGSEPLTHETGNVHGESVMPIKRLVLASKVRMLIRQTSRPPTDAPPTRANGDAPFAPPPAFDNSLGIGENTGSNSDPVDASFAISRLKIIGHEPR